MPIPWVIGDEDLSRLDPYFSSWGHSGKNPGRGKEGGRLPPKRKFLEKKRDEIKEERDQFANLDIIANRDIEISKRNSKSWNNYEDYLAQSWAMKNKHTKEEQHKGDHRVKHVEEKEDSGRAQYQRGLGYEEDEELLM